MYVHAIESVMLASHLSFRQTSRRPKARPSHRLTEPRAAMAAVCTLGNRINRKLCNILCNMDNTDCVTMDRNENVKLSKGVSSLPLQPARAISVGGPNMVSGLVVVDDIMYVSHHCESQIWVYSVKSGALRNKVEISGMTAPVGMTLLNAGRHPKDGVVQLAISDCNGQQLHLVTLSQQNIVISHHAHTLTYTPGSLSLDPNGNLIIADPDHNRIMIHDADDGRVMRSVQLSRDVESVRHVVAIGNGYAVLDYDGCCVVWTDHHGAMLGCYGNMPGEELTDPKYALHDGHDGLIVCDTWNHRLHLINEDTDLVGYLATELCIPSCMFLDQNKAKLYVAHGDRSAGEVLIYNYGRL